MADANPSKPSAKAGPEIPAEAQTGGALNAAPVPSDIRRKVPVPKSKDLDKGPDRDADTGSYRPAAYKKKRILRSTGETYEITRIDR